MELPLRLPDPPPRHRDVVLRALDQRDLAMLRDLSTDSYVPLIGTLPAHADDEGAQGFVARQQDRLVTGAGWSWCVALADSDEGVGHAGLWLHSLTAGRATAGYAIAPSHRGRGLAAQALAALTEAAWTIPELHRVELYVEPWNVPSARTAVAAGYRHEGRLRSHQEIGGRRVDMDVYAAVRPAGRLGQEADEDRAADGRPTGIAHDGVPPVLVVVGGLPATGKTTVGRAVVRALGAAYVRVDTIETALGRGDGDPGPADGYLVAYDVARDQLALGLPVVAECVNPLAVTRDAWRDVALRAGARLLEVELVCSDPHLHRSRLEGRVLDVEGLRNPTWAEVRGREYAPWDREPLRIDTATVPAHEAARLVVRAATTPPATTD